MLTQQHAQIIDARAAELMATDRLTQAQSAQARAQQALADAGRAVSAEIGDEQALANFIAAALSAGATPAQAASTGAEALQLLRRGTPVVVPFPS